MRSPLLKKDIERAQLNSMSATEAAKFLHVSYKTYKKYAEMYGVFTTNRGGKGIQKIRKKGVVGLDRVLEGELPRYSHRRLKERVIRAGVFPNECGLCGFNSARPDGRVPLQLYFKDGDGLNLRKENLDLRCLNCVYLTTGTARMSVIRDYDLDHNELELDLNQVDLTEDEITQLQEDATS